MKITYFFIVISFLLLVPFVLADTIYVDVNATGAEDGSSWADAYTSIQTAIDNSSNGFEIIVAEGVYTENVYMKGTEVILRSTDPNDAAVTAATIIDGDSSGSVITCDSGETADTVIKGFWIQNGSGNISTGNGGGLYCQGSYPVIQSCVFIDNDATGGYGGGIFCYGGAPTISGCILIGNSIGTNGGGIACYTSDAIIENCVFSGNEASQRGGGLYCYQSDVTATNCTFSQNSASNQGGALYCSQSNPVIINCIMWGDSADNGGDEIYSSVSSPSVSYSVIEGGWAGSGSNNFTSDPLFIDADGDDDVAGTADDDLHLDPFTFCINAGDPSGDYTGQRGMDGEDRVLYGSVDIGADEVFPIGADLDEDEQVDTADIILFVDDDSWLVEVDLIDFALFAGQWLYGVEDSITGDLAVVAENWLLK